MKFKIGDVVNSLYFGQEDRCIIVGFYNKVIDNRNFLVRFDTPRGNSIYIYPKWNVNNISEEGDFFWALKESEMKAVKVRDTKLARKVHAKNTKEIKNGWIYFKS